jgi:hypothetical protein
MCSLTKRYVFCCPGEGPYIYCYISPAVLTAHDQAFIDKMIYAANYRSKKGQYRKGTYEHMRLIRNALTDDCKADWMEEFMNITDPTMFATGSVVDNALQLTAKWEIVDNCFISSILPTNETLMKLSAEFQIILIMANDWC